MLLNCQQNSVKDQYRPKILFLAVWGALFLIYRLWLNGRFAEMAVRFLSLLNGSYQKSLELYDRLVRNYEDFDFFLAVLVLFVFLMRIYFHSFRKYFTEVERGIDSLAQEQAEDVRLSPELRFMTSWPPTTGRPARM